jgi:tRNA/tmRNA/rRNA uracil-C5-methylase (TrmA/RlmC/RlmD family)
MEYSFSSIEHDLDLNEEKDNAFALGFKRRGTWWKVESLNHQSGLFDEEFESKLKEIRVYLEQTGLAAWHPPKKTGFFRHIVVRKSFYQNQLLINLVTSSEGLEKFDVQKFSSFLVQLLGERLAGLQHTINDNVADRAKIENGTNQLVFGDSIVVEQLSGLFFEISVAHPVCVISSVHAILWQMTSSKQWSNFCSRIPTMSQEMPFAVLFWC